MARIAEELSAPLIRISFVGAMSEFVHEWPLTAGMPRRAIPRHVATLPDTSSLHDEENESIRAP